MNINCIRIRKIVLLVLSLSIVSCAGDTATSLSTGETKQTPHVAATSTSVITDYPTSTQSPNNTSTVVPSPQVIAEPTTFVGVKPEWISSCQESHQVGFDEMHFPTDLKLLVRPVNELAFVETGVYFFSLDLNEPSLLPDTIPQEDWIYYAFQPIYEGPLLEYVRYREGSAERETWIRSLDGMRNELLYRWNVNESVRIWENELLYIDDQFDIGASRPSRIVSTVTGEIKELPPLPEDALFHYAFKYEEQWYAIYYFGLGKYEEIFLFSFSSGESPPIFPWLLNDKTINFHTAGISHGRIFVTREYGFDFSMDFAFDDLFKNFDYDEVMTRVVLTDSPTERTYDFVEWPLLESNRFIIEDWSDLDESKYYILDLSLETITDLCFTIADRSFVYLSPDGRYFAITSWHYRFENEEDSNTLDGTYVYDLEQKEYAFLPGWRVEGWIDIDAE